MEIKAEVPLFTSVFLLRNGPKTVYVCFFGNFLLRVCVYINGAVILADGVTHAAAADRVIVAGTILAGTAVAAGLHPLPAAILVAGLILGKYASSDVRDQEQVTNYPEQLVYQNLGTLPGLVWQAIWWPFAKRLPHRSPHSHFPGWATLLAWLWLFTVPLLSCLIFSFGLFPLAFSVAVLLFPGWVVQDYVHLWLDGGFQAIRW